jgi:hypothetical protein
VLGRTHAHPRQRPQVYWSPCLHATQFRPTSPRHAASVLKLPSFAAVDPPRYYARSWATVATSNPRATSRTWRRQRRTPQSASTANARGGTHPATTTSFPTNRSNRFPSLRRPEPRFYADAYLVALDHRLCSETRGPPARCARRGCDDDKSGEMGGKGLEPLTLAV